MESGPEFASDMFDDANHSNAIIPSFYVTFNSLPLECRYKIFSLLDVIDKGRSFQVCHEWNDILHNSRLWDHVDLIPLAHYGHDNAKHTKNIGRRISSFIDLLIQINPIIKSLKFHFEKADLDTVNALISLITKTDCKKLISVFITWKDDENDAPQCIFRFIMFHRFLDHLTLKAPNIEKLTYHWNWSSQTFQLITRLKKLQTLDVRKLVFSPQTLQQPVLDDIFNLPTLKTLYLNLCFCPGKRENVSFYLKSFSLLQLDLSRCEKLLIEFVDLPNLKIINLSRKSSEYYRDNSHKINCWYDLLQKGCPSLELINHHMLKVTWRSTIYDELEELLRTICLCPVHKWVPNNLEYNHIDSEEPT